MPFPVDNIRKACAKKNTTLKQLEKDLVIGNGVIAKWEKAKGSPPYDRIVAIAEHLNVPVSELTGEGQKNIPSVAGEEEDEATKELRNIWDTAGQDERATLLEMARFLKNRREQSGIV